KGHQPTHRRIDPTIERYIARSHISRIRHRLFLSFVEGAPLRGFSVVVVRVSAKDLPPHIPTQRTSDQNISRKMLLSRETGRADCSCSAVCENLRKRTRVFMGDYAGNRPTNCGVL